MEVKITTECIDETNQTFINGHSSNARYRELCVLMPSIRVGYFSRWSDEKKCYQSFVCYPTLAAEPTSYEI